MAKGVAFVLCVLCVLGALGCKTAPACPVQARTDPKRALSDHAEGRARWQSLKAEARVTQWGRGGRVRGTVLMFLEQPSRVRFDVMTQVGPAAVLTSDGDTFQLTDFRENTFLNGPTCPRNIERLLGIPLDAEDVLRILTGDAPTIDAAEESMRCEEGQYVVTLRTDDGTTQALSFSVPDADRSAAPDAQRLLLSESVVRAPDGSTRWRSTYEDYFEIDGQSFPRSIRFVDETAGTDTAVRVKSLDLNPEIPEGVFQQVPAPGLTVELADCG